MKVLVENSRVNGRAVAPPSKSYTIRGLMCAALAQGDSEIANPLISDDTAAAASALEQVGVSVRKRDGCWVVNGGSLKRPGGDLFCGDSAATLRFLTAICSLIPGCCRLTVGPSLAGRPVRPLIRALRQLGVDCSSQGEFAPVVVNGGRLRGGVVELAGNVSSQFVSALLLMAPLAEEGVTIRLSTSLESKSYVLMTLECLREFGVAVETSPDLTELRVARQVYQPAEYAVEGDWSSASYLLALGAIAGEVTVDNMNPQSLQGDRAILGFLKDMGALVDINGNSVTLQPAGLKALKADFNDCIDLLPTMAILAAAADGVSEFSSIDRARLKESDRVMAVREGLERMGVRVTEEKDRLTITGPAAGGSVIDSKGDHRIAMAFAVLGSVIGKTTIAGAECVTKTFPDFWGILESTGVRLRYNE
ncbi:3-phosphoshikimate 1-carboxyvinyltransferase [Chloroflexota bacterium]